MKTALQDLLDDCNRDLIISEILGDNVTTNLLKKLIYYINQNLLEKEKDQINVSFISGAIEALSYRTPVRDRIKDGYFENKAEQYFNHTYKEINND